jgi:hypothetical protein
VKLFRDIAGFMRRAGARGALALCLLAPGTLLMAPPQARAQAAVQEASEEKLEAAYMLKFLNYVEWPAASFSGPTAPYLIGVAGDDAVADELARISAGKIINGRPVQVRRVVASDSMEDIDMVFIGRGERARQAALLSRLRARPVLTITAGEDGLDLGSIINFRIVENRLRFEVSLDAAERAGIRLSARLLGVAINVVKGKR